MLEMGMGAGAGTEVGMVGESDWSGVRDLE